MLAREKIVKMCCRFVADKLADVGDAVIGFLQQALRLFHAKSRGEFGESCTAFFAETARELGARHINFLRHFFQCQVFVQMVADVFASIRDGVVRRLQCGIVGNYGVGITSAVAGNKNVLAASCVRAKASVT